MMTRYAEFLFWSVLLGFFTLPCHLFAASITEKHAEFGYECNASDKYSTAMGGWTTASGWYSTAMGQGTTASATGSTAMGNGTTASGNYSTAMGTHTTASGGSSTAIGCSTTAGGSYSWAGGYQMHLDESADQTFVWGFALEAQTISASDAFLVFPVQDSGRLGIGTKDPKNLLDLGATQGKKLAVFQKTTGEDFYGFGISSATLEIYAGAASGDTNPAMVVKKKNGNVGIGTNSPNYLLEVDGSAGKPGGSTWSNSSDERLKDIIGEYTVGLNELVLLKPVSFYYKADNPRGLPSDEEYVGFIAQEVQEVFPKAVNEGPDGYLDFNMHPVNVALVNAVKELKAKNDALESRNASLEKEIEKIKAILGI